MEIFSLMVLGSCAEASAIESFFFVFQGIFSSVRVIDVFFQAIVSDLVIFCEPFRLTGIVGLEVSFEANLVVSIGRPRASLKILRVVCLCGGLALVNGEFFCPDHLASSSSFCHRNLLMTIASACPSSPSYRARF